MNGLVHKYDVNVTANNIYSQTDEDGCRYQIMELMMLRRSDNTLVPLEGVFEYNKSGIKTGKILPKDGTFLYNFGTGNRIVYP